MTSPNGPQPQGEGPEQPFVSHLIELRDRLLRCVLAVVLLLLPLLYFANDLYTLLATPLLRHLPQGSSMIAIEVASPFLTPFKLALVTSIFAAMPYVLYQFWAFVAPGLYAQERRLVVPLIISSTLLFYLGMVFAYFVVFPLIFAFLTGTAPQGVAVMTDISKYLDFVLKLVFAFGVAFEVPIATIVLVWTGVTTPDKLVAKRPYIIVGAFVIGMLLTPPDIISQSLLALPMWLLFEIGVFFARRFQRKQESEPEEDEARTIMPAGGAAAGGVATAAAPNSAAAGAEHDAESEHEMSDADMEAELDRIEAEEAAQEGEPDAARKPDQPGSDKDPH